MISKHEEYFPPPVDSLLVVDAMMGEHLLNVEEL